MTGLSSGWAGLAHRPSTTGCHHGTDIRLPQSQSCKSHHCKITDAAGDLKTKTASKPVQYKPITPWDPEANRPKPTATERFEQSAVLQHHAAIHRPPPPPKRIHAPTSATAEQEEGRGSSQPPRLPYRSLPSSSNATTPPVAPPSLPSRKPAFDAAGSAPPAPPPRTNSSSSAAVSSSNPGRAVPAPPPNAAAPPYQHAVDHDLPRRTSPAAPPRTAPRSFVRFSEYGTAEKEELFAMLDDFFEARLSSLRLGGDETTSPSQLKENSMSNFPRAAISPPPNVHAVPPPVSLRTRPPIAAAHTRSDLPSYPPPQTHSSSALSLCHWIMYEPYATPWYNESSPLPPPIQGRNDMRYSGSWSSMGSSKTVMGLAVFGDASCCWWSLSFDTRSPTQVDRQARYRPVPSPWSGEQLYSASEKYSSEIVAFVHQAHASGRPVARGECWDVASEALNHVNRPGVPEPFPSIGRSHGHLIYYGRAEGRGVWRGGDCYIRPGDVVEWRLVTINQADAPVGSYSTLGDPDHTAVIVDVGTPKLTPADGEELDVTQLPNLTVVEQSQGKAPFLSTYDLATMSKGEVWVYRPVPLVEFIGTEIKVEWPPKCQTWEVGQLESRLGEVETNDREGLGSLLFSGTQSAFETLAVKPVRRRTSKMRATVTVCRFCSAITRSYSTSTSTSPSLAATPDASTCLRQAMRSVAQPVAVVTIPLDPTRPKMDTHGATLSSLSSISLSPPIVAFSLRLPSRLATYLMDPGTSSRRTDDSTIREGRTMRIHLLSHHQEDLARTFAGQALIVSKTSAGKADTRPNKVQGPSSSEFDPRLFERLRSSSLGTLECRLIKSISLRTLEEDARREQAAVEGIRGVEAAEECAPRSELFLAKVVHVDLPRGGEGHQSLVYKGQAYRHV
ncbi:BQ2448_1863 [Microbotryum intermedium]|uniref:BQ2448_1863 protein n=1 Tax=Microbotryum intermedium TaxID=269621 RepID=A0A238FCG1_9BASI|nr:BQ2448_1863 [Microbotryum intermedium]